MFLLMRPLNKIVKTLEEAKERGEVSEWDVELVKKVVEAGQMKKVAEGMRMPYSTLKSRIYSMMGKGLLPKNFTKMLAEKRLKERLKRLEEFELEAEEEERPTGMEALADIIRGVAFPRGRIIVRREEKSELEKILEEEERLMVRKLRLARLEKMYKETMREIERLRRKDEEGKPKKRGLSLIDLVKVAEREGMSIEDVIIAYMILSAMHS